MIEVLGRASSINVRKVLWTCAELNLAVRHVPWGEGDLSLRSPEFLVMNPNALVPVLRDGAFVLRESNTICRYLAAREARTDLLPTEPAAHARVEQWMDWQATELNNAWRYPFMSLVRRSAAHSDETALQAGIDSWTQHMRILDNTLADTGAYVTGATFTLADVVLGLSVHRWFATPIDHPRLGAVAAYYERLSARPGYRLHGRNGLP